MLKAPCPSCGGEVQFLMETSVLAICPYCRSNIIRHDVNLELIGKQADLIEDMSPLQIGSFGHYKNKSFQIIGRYIVGWENGRWNEWYIAFNDGTGGWLAEAQGEFFILFETQNVTPDEFSDPSTLRVGKVRYEAVDKKEAKCLGSEGELPFKAVPGRVTKNIDYSDFQGRFATLEIEDGNAKLFTGYEKSLRELQMKNLRYFEGWGRF